MTLSGADRAVLRTLYPHAFVGVPEEELGEILDRWYADDHFDGNPAYLQESHDHADSHL